MAGGSPSIAVPFKYRVSRLSEITSNVRSFEQPLRMRVFRESRVIFGRDKRLVHPLRFRKTSFFIFFISSGNSFKLVQPSRFNLKRFGTSDRLEMEVNSLE